MDSQSPAMVGFGVLVIVGLGFDSPRRLISAGQRPDRGSSRSLGLLRGLHGPSFRRSEWVSRGLRRYASLTVRSLLIMVGVRVTTAGRAPSGVTGEPVHLRWLAGAG